MNVLVYYGDETVATNRPEYLASLRQILFPKYAVAPITSDALLNEPWTESCALLVLSGREYLELRRRMGPRGTARIKDFVRSGGRCLGIHAGAYYGSELCIDVDVGDNHADDRVGNNLGFFPGGCRGYFARPATNPTRVATITAREGGHGFAVYDRGGGAFSDFDSSTPDGFAVIAHYVLDDETGPDTEGGIAVVYCPAGQGACVLASSHIEVDVRSLPSDTKGSDEDYIALLQGDESRVEFLRQCVSKLGLEVNTDQEAAPALTTLHLSSASGAFAARLKNALAEYIQEGITADDHDSFRFETQSDGSRIRDDDFNWKENANQAVTDSTAKHIIIHDGHPSSEVAPLFNHDNFFASLGPVGDVWFGSHLLYGEVMESTNTILAKNHKLLQALPTGFTALASLQTAGRGRGSNVWVSPIGCLLFSTCIRHPAGACARSPVVFVQYIAALAVVEAVKSYAPGYEEFPIHIKWPNDIYVRESQDAEDGRPQHAKIGGVLVQCSYINDDYILVAGIGLNTTNASPSTSLRRVSDQLNVRRVSSGLDLLEAVSPEELLARILQAFEKLYVDFRIHGWAESLNDLYIKHWLHTGQIVTIESISGRPRTRIVGIDDTSANLLVEELGADDRPTGRRHELGPDGNSFDFFHGLIKSKE